MSNGFSYLIWLPLAALSTTLLAFAFQALATRRRISKECRAIQRHGEWIATTIEKTAEITHGRLSIRDFRKRIATHSAKCDPVFQLLIESVGAPADTQARRIDSLVHRAFGGTLSASIRTLGNLSVLVALGVTSTKILMSLIQMGNADPKTTTAMIGHGLLSTVAGATLAALALLLNWLILDSSLERIHDVLTTTVQRGDDAFRVHTQPAAVPSFLPMRADVSAPRSTRAATLPRLSSVECLGRAPVPSAPLPRNSGNGNGDRPHAQD